MEVHRSAEAFNFVTQQSDQVRARLSQTEEELKQLKSKAGITSLAESTALINAELAGSQNALRAAKTEYAEQKARVQEMEKSLEAQAKASTPEAQPPAVDAEALQRYQALLAQLDSLRQLQTQLLAKYSEKAAQPQVPDELERDREIHPVQRAQDKRGKDLVATDRSLPLGFVGAERDMAQALARERYRQQNNSGFAYQGQEGLRYTRQGSRRRDPRTEAGTLQADKASQLELVRITQMQIENVEQQRTDLEKRNPEIRGDFAAAAGRIISARSA